MPFLVDASVPRAPETGRANMVGWEGGDSWIPEGQSDFAGNRKVLEEELGRDLHRMFLIEPPVVAFSMERHGTSGAASVPGAVPQLRAAHLRRLDDGASALPGVAGAAESDLDDVRGQSRTSKPQAGRGATLPNGQKAQDIGLRHR